VSPLSFYRGQTKQISSEMADDEWVAVEPEFQNTTTKIKGATSAYMYFQKDAHEQVTSTFNQHACTFYFFIFIIQLLSTSNFHFQGIGNGLDLSERMKAIAEAVSFYHIRSVVLVLYPMCDYLQLHTSMCNKKII
jgi:hypothetical protein